MPRKRRTPQREKKPNSLKTGVSGKRFRKDPAFKQSRRAMSEFGLGSDAGTLLRRAFATELGNIPQKFTHARLTRSITALVREKKAAGAERIRLNQLDWQQLRKFEFNPEANLSGLLASDYKLTINQSTARINIALSGVQVSRSVAILREITHVTVVAGAAAIDFEKETIANDHSVTAPISKKQGMTEQIDMSLQLPGPVIHPLFIALGFAIFKQDGGRLYPLYNLRYRAVSIIHVHPAPPPAYKKKPVPLPKAAKKPVKKKQTKKAARPKTKRR
jgi:hypothetical protein